MISTASGYSEHVNDVTGLHEGDVVTVYIESQLATPIEHSSDKANATFRKRADGVEDGDRGSGRQTQ